jgi:O-antigen/teichoic acid export membrane protein
VTVGVTRVSHVKLTNSPDPDEFAPPEPDFIDDWFRPAPGPGSRDRRRGDVAVRTRSVFVTTGEMPATTLTLELPIFAAEESERDRPTGGRAVRFHSAYALIINTVSTTGLGFIYWAIAAHVYSRQTVGRSSALISALVLLSTLAQLNVSSALQKYLPKAGGSARRLIGYGYAVSCLAALPVAIGFVFLMPRLSGQWKFLSASTPLVLLFVAAALTWGIFALEDAALTGLRRTTVVPIENSVYGVLKLGMLIGVAALLPASGIFASWVVPLVVVIPVINILIFLRYAPRSGGQPAQFRRQEIVRFTSADYLASMFNQAYASLLPLMVLSVLGAAANSGFYIAWTIAAGPTMIAANFGTSLMVEVATAPDRMAELTRGMVLRCTVITLLCTAVLAVAAHPILRIYGKGYAEQAAPLLVVLGLATVPRALIMLTWSLDRVTGRMGRAALTQAVLAVLVLAGSRLLLRKYGIEGIGYAWFAANVAVALVRLPTLAKAAGLGSQWRTLAIAAVSGRGQQAAGRSSAVGRRPVGKHRATGR